MFKIKLLILLLNSFLFLTCTNSQQENIIKFSVGYIGGEYDGLLLANQLRSHLRNFNMLDDKSEFQIQASISHSSNVFITNIDNTSDREKIKSSINLKIYNKKSECYVYSYLDSTTQFYILASSDNFTSNKKASQQIKFENTEYFVKKFLNSLTVGELVCNEKK
tara:strand:+ start:1184 stop:1675 length:492 start_codon:yes stop_codon:yes gene_type:complete